MADCMNEEYKKKKEKIRSVLPGHDFSATLTSLKKIFHFTKLHSHVTHNAV